VAVAGVAVAAVAVAPGQARAASGFSVERWGTFSADGPPASTRLTPVAVRLPGPVAEVASSNSDQYALLANGTVYAWGKGGDGQLGDGGTASSFTKAVRVKFPAGVKIAALATDAMPLNSALAVDTTGHAWGWGFNKGGELCLGNTSQHDTPVKLPFSHVSTLAGAFNHAVYDAGGAVYSCGLNPYGQLGNGTFHSSDHPVTVTGLDGASVTTLVAAWGNEGALLANGDYDDWGYDAGGQLGNGTTGRNADAPVRVPLPEPVTQVTQGGSIPTNGQTLVLLSGGAVYAWGNGHGYQLGNGTAAIEDSPVPISPPAGVAYRALATAGGTSYALSTAGDVYAWGNNDLGQIGNGTKTTAQQPVEVGSGATMISATAADVVTGP
jgi:alpha-tubulin suppressor-like RCC1 family protein